MTDTETPKAPSSGLVAEPGLRVVQRLATAESASQELHKYESYRSSSYKDVFGGSLREFWENVTRHMDASQLQMESYIVYLQQVLNQEQLFIKSVKQSLAKLPGTPKQSENKTGTDMILDEFIAFQNASFASKKSFCTALQKDVIKPIKSLQTRHKSDTDAARSTALKLEQKVDAAHTLVLKQFRTFSQLYAKIQSAGVQAVEARGTSEKDLWMEEAAYCRLAKKFINMCTDYRRTMSELYVVYQKSEVNRVQALKSILQKYARLIQGNYLAIANSQELTMFAAAVEQLNQEKEVVLQLKQVQDRPKRSGTEASGKKGPNESASKLADEVSAKVPRAFASKMIVHQGSLNMKAGLFQNWKNYHCVITMEDHMFLFELDAVDGGEGEPTNIDPVVFFQIGQSTVKIGKEPLTFEVIETSKGFLGISSTKKQLFKAETEPAVKAFTSHFQLAEETK